jgi:hypothetical protein
MREAVSLPARADSQAASSSPSRIGQVLRERAGVSLERGVGVHIIRLLSNREGILQRGAKFALVLRLVQLLLESFDLIFRQRLGLILKRLDTALVVLARLEQQRL